MVECSFSELIFVESVFRVIFGVLIFGVDDISDIVHSCFGEWVGAEHFNTCAA